MNEHGERGICGICAIIDRIRRGQFADFVAELDASWLILGDQQFYRGYCVLFAKLHATEMFLMPPHAARILFEEVRLTAEAIVTVVNPWKMNYECLGNVEPHVHWHLFPRSHDETEALKRAPVWIRPESERKLSLEESDRRALLASIKHEIALRLPDARIAAD